MANAAPAWISALEPATALGLADAILALHLAIVAFNLVMPPAILLGAWRGWGWVRARWLRLLHLGSMAVVALQAALGDLCFLTVWEHDLRVHAGAAAADESFIETLLAELLYVDVPLAVLIPIYFGWAALALALWWLVPPRRHNRR
ncbi:MAG: DUF2784 domain-containing protein [Silanimonas sp.]